MRKVTAIFDFFIFDTCNFFYKTSVKVIVEQSDFDLIDKINAGDQQAIRVLIDRHRNYAYTIAIRVLNNKQDAEEVSQDAFVKALNSLKAFNKKSKFTTWFYTIVFHAAVSLKRRKRIITEDIDMHHSSKLGIFETMHFQKKEQKLFIDRALQSLKEEDKHVLTLFYLKELSLEEVGVILDISSNTVKTKVHRARKRLAKALSLLLRDEVTTLL